ncbi:MAG TPA: UDP-glucose/GDP-mannose dehydrogenase family protein [Chloroflexia bacterium]|nr:UDP-glucose/GDP-mannose dehydrogenase family protein [Chloroflexia bacterium]
MSKISVVGVNYVGLVTAACFADLGNEVMGIEIVPEKVERLRQGISPIYEPGIEEVLQRNLKAGRLNFTTDYADGLREADFVFIAVGTPEGPDGAADMSQVQSAARSIGQHASGDIIVINKSTVPIGTGDLVTRLVGEGIKQGLKFSVVSNPEFLREGSALNDFMHPDRVVLGSSDREASDKVAVLYEPLDAPVIISDIRTAEMIKYASNAILATRISFMNEVAHICESLGADAKQVALGMGYDKRIGPQFLDAGIGYGGSCFPKDVKALAHMAASNDCHPQLLNAVMDINHDARAHFVEKVTRLLGGDVAGKRIGVWGLSFKPNTDDIREAPQIDIVQALAKAGAQLQVYDPVAMDNARRVLPDVAYCANAYEAASGVDAVLLLTEWNEFKQLDMARVRGSLRRALLVDGRNMFVPAEMRAQGFEYASVGRP